MDGEGALGVMDEAAFSPLTISLCQPLIHGLVQLWQRAAVSLISTQEFAEICFIAGKPSLCIIYVKTLSKLFVGFRAAGKVVMKAVMNALLTCTSNLSMQPN